VEIISQVVNKKSAKLTNEELVDAEVERQFAEKMKACPFFAAINRGDAA